MPHLETETPGYKPEQGERVANGVTKYHVDPEVLPSVPELRRGAIENIIRGGPELRVADLDTQPVLEWDVAVRAAVGEKERLGELVNFITVKYQAGAELAGHNDWEAPDQVKAVIVSGQGEGEMSFPESDPIKTVPGDMVVLDGEVNPFHSARAITDRAVVQLTYRTIPPVAG